MSATLEALRARFPKARFTYAPAPTCKRCSGSGVRPPKTLPSGTQLNESPCACLFFGPNTDAMVPLIANAAKKALAELKGETP